MAKITIEHVEQLPEQPDAETYLMCARGVATQPGQVNGICAQCERSIIFSVNAPPRLVKICRECTDEKLQAAGGGCLKLADDVLEEVLAHLGYEGPVTEEIREMFRKMVEERYGRAAAGND